MAPPGSHRPSTPAELRENLIRDLVKRVRMGRPVVPLVGAGISVEAGVPPLLGVTHYLAKTKSYLRYGVFKNLSPAEEGEPPLARMLQDGPQAFSQQPRDFLREFGWPDFHELNSNLWHWLWRHSPSRERFYDALDTLVDSEILESLWRVDDQFIDTVRKLKQPEAQKWGLNGSYWKILLTQLTRSSPDLIDTLFQRLTRKREPATAHRYLSFLTPVLRLRLFLTINFDTLLEDALRIEGLGPTVYEVADGLSLPHPKLVQEGISVVKLHGGAYGLLVGDRLDSPLDEETRSRFRAYLPEHLILLVMGIGGWDQRVLDMVELAHERQGEVFWLYFEGDVPKPLKERFGSRRNRNQELPAWLRAIRVQDPGAFLREVYGEYKQAHPSSSRPFQAADLRPVFLEPDPAKAAPPVGERVVVFVDREGDYGLGASLSLARYVASKAKSHLPLWIDVETKFTVEDLVVDLLHQLRRYDPGLPPEILAIERSTLPSGGGAPQAKADFRKVVRRLYAALARGRYVVALNGVRSFGRPPTFHHAYGGEAERRGRELEGFLRELIDGIGLPEGGRQPESLGLLDSSLAFSLSPRTAGSRIDEILLAGREPDPLPADTPFLPRETFPAAADSALWQREPVLVLLAAFRRRRSLVALLRLVPKYLELEPRPARSNGRPPTPDEVTESVKEKLRALEAGSYIWRIEGGDSWMSRKLRNEIYDHVHDAADRGASAAERIRALAMLTFVHHDLAEHHHRDLYVGSQDVGSFLEALYHQISALRHLRALQQEAAAGEPLDPALAAWIDPLARPVSRVTVEGRAVAPPEREWFEEPRLIDGDGRLSAEALLERRWRGLRSLREVLKQEREALLSRVPSKTLQGWVAAIREDLEVVAEAGEAAAEDWPRALAAEKGQLAELLEDLEIEVLQDRMKAREILARRSAWLWGQAGRPPLGEETAAAVDWMLREVPAEPELLVRELVEVGDPAARRRVVQALCDVARALLRSHWRAGDARRAAPRVEGVLHDLLAAWRRPEKRRAEELATLLDLQLMDLRLVADQALWGKSPWDHKGHGLADIEAQQEAAFAALQASESAIQILEAIHEEDRTPRSHFYSVKGRALYLLSDFEGAYREFDLARAGLAEATPAEREALAVSLLRKAECLMVHSDEGLAAWMIERIEGGDPDRGLPWSNALSTEGWRKFYGHPPPEADDEAADRAARRLLGLSLANCRPELLRYFESVVRDSDDEEELVDTLGTMRSRLAAARDLLDRVESLLEHSRRKVEWWACLFQLRAQLAVERLLLLLSGDLSILDAGIQRDFRPAGARGNRGEADWESIRSWLLSPESRRNAELPDLADPLVADPVLRRRFINRFQGLLRQGVMAVRQGLDILLPGDLERREPGRLENDVLLGRLLRLWTELMVCGSYATEMSQRAMLDDNLREREQGVGRWEQWHYLNTLSGLVVLPSSPELPGDLRPIEDWFVEHDWDIGPPGLASRARVLTRMDLCLIAPAPSSPIGRGERRKTLDFAGGDALRRLHAVLRVAERRVVEEAGGPAPAAAAPPPAPPAAKRRRSRKGSS